MELTPPSTPICTMQPGEDDSARRAEDATRPELPSHAPTTATTRIPNDAEVAARPVSSITPHGSPKLPEPNTSPGPLTVVNGAASPCGPPAERASGEPPAAAPTMESARALRARISETFAAGDWDTLSDLLSNARPLPLRTRVVTVWLPLTELLAERANADADARPSSPRPASDTMPAALSQRVRSADAERELSSRLRAEIRLALAAFEDAHPELWLVPATPLDETATYLGALVLSLRGHPTRPWIWKVTPPGLAVTISVTPSKSVATGGSFGRTTLAELCAQNGLL